MTLPIPSLDDRTFEDLVEEAVSLIPLHDPDWTNHNPSDPGITLVELFAWLTEMMIYRLDRITPAHTLTFLRLLNGPDWTPKAGRPLDDEVRASISHLRRRFRAVSCRDYELLARDASPDVARALCVPRRNLQARTAGERAAQASGHVSLVVIPAQDDPLADLRPAPSPGLRRTILGHLEPRRILTTSNHVVGPDYTGIGMEVVAVRHPNRTAEDLQGDIVRGLRRFLHPLAGGPAGAGWPLGRPVYVSEVIQFLEGIPGLDYVTAVDLFAAPAPGEPAATVMWHGDGELIGVNPGTHRLPAAEISAAGVTVADSARAMLVPVMVVPKPGVDPLMVMGEVKRAVRRALHPAHGGPGGPAAASASAEAIAAGVARLEVVAEVVAVDCRTAFAEGPVPCGAAEVADPQIFVTVQGASS